MATISNTPRPGYVWDSTDNVWYPIGVGGHSHSEIAKTIADAKGDLIVGTAADTVDRLAVGNNGETLVADSSTSSGLRWQGAYAAGKNAILNSNFSIWQRGTSIASTGGSGVYTADRWSAYNASYTVSQQDTSDTTNLPFIAKCARVIRRVGETSVAGANLVQPLESINSKPFIGKVATLSFYARAGANYSSASSALLVFLLGGTGTDQNPNNTYTGQTSILSPTATLTTTWQRFSYTTSSAIATTVNELAVQFSSVGVGTAGAADYFEVTGVQLEIGSVATAYSTNSGTFQGELAACQRYYIELADGSVTNGFGARWNGTTLYYSIPTPVEMRTLPTAAYIGTIYYEGAGMTGTLSSPATQAKRPGFLCILATTSNTPTSAYVFVVSSGKHTFSAEL